MSLLFKLETEDCLTEIMSIADALVEARLGSGISAAVVIFDQEGSVLATTHSDLSEALRVIESAAAGIRSALVLGAEQPGAKKRLN